MLKFTVLLIFLIQNSVAFNQELNLDSLSQINNQLGIIKLPTLQAAIDSAIVHSPRIQMQDALLKQSEHALKAYKSSWAKELAISAETKYGNYGNNLALDNLGIGYGGGVSVRLPLSILIGRKDNINVKVYQTIAVDQKKNEEIQLLKIKVSNIYNDLVLKEKVLILSNDALSNSTINYQYAQLQYSNDQIDIGVYSRVYDFYVKAILVFEQAKTEYQQALFVLEEVIGVEISK